MKHLNPLKYLWIAAVFAFVIILDSHAYPADGQTIAIKVDYDRIYEIAMELKSLAEQGKIIHHNYDLNNMGQLKECVKTNNHLRDEAKLLAEETREMGAFFYRAQLYPASWLAFECVFCGDTLKSCYDIQPYLDKTFKMLRDDGYSARSSQTNYRKHSLY